MTIEATKFRQLEFSKLEIIFPLSFRSILIIAKLPEFLSGLKLALSIIKSL